MNNSSKTQSILRDKSPKLTTEDQECSPCEAARRAREAELAKQQEEGATCVPCKQKEQQQNTIWKVFVNNSDIDPNRSDVLDRYKVIGNVLLQYSGFTDAQVQSIFTTIGLIPNDWHLIYSGNEAISIAIHNELARLGYGPKLQAALKTF